MESRQCKNHALTGLAVSHTLPSLKTIVFIALLVALFGAARAQASFGAGQYAGSISSRFGRFDLNIAVQSDGRVFYSLSRDGTTVIAFEPAAVQRTGIVAAKFHDGNVLGTMRANPGTMSARLSIFARNGWSFTRRIDLHRVESSPINYGHGFLGGVIISGSIPTSALPPHIINYEIMTPE